MPTDASNATILELSADMIPHSGAFVRVNLHFFVANSLIMPSLTRHRANRTSTQYYQAKAKSHAGKFAVAQDAHHATGRVLFKSIPQSARDRPLSTDIFALFVVKMSTGCLEFTHFLSSEMHRALENEGRSTFRQVVFSGCLEENSEGLQRGLRYRSA